MKRPTLKQTLAHYVRQMEQTLHLLRSSDASRNDLQTRSLDILAFNLQRLVTLVEALPDGTLSPMLRHELRNVLTVITGYAQILLHRQAGELTAEATGQVNMLIRLVSQINTTLEQDQHQAHHI